MFLKFPHTYAKTSKSLNTISKKVNKYIIIHDTQINYRPDITQAMRDLVSTGDWFVYAHINSGWGLTVLTREEPSHFAIAWDVPEGVGTEVKKMLKLVGIEATENCSCNRHAITMNGRGPEWCRENIETIIDWMGEEAKKRKVPFVRVACKLMVQRAIRTVLKNEKMEKNLTAGAV